MIEAAPDLEANRQILDQNPSTAASGAHLDLNHAPYVLYGVKNIDLASLQAQRSVLPLPCDLNHAPHIHHPTLP